MATKESNEAQNDKFATILLLSEHMSQQFLDETFADVTFITNDGERIPGHRQILAARSSYFKALLYGGLAETNQNEVKIQANTEPFKVVLNYLYSGYLSLGSIENGILFETLSLADQYGIESLWAIIVRHLEQNFLSIENVGATFDLAQLLGLHSFIEKSLSKFTDKFAVEILQLESNSNLSRASLCAMLKRDSFLAPEIDIFRFVKKWLEQNPKEQENAAEVTSLIRIPLLTHDQLLDEVASCGLFEAQQIIEAFLAKRCPEKLVFRRAEGEKRKMNINLVSTASCVQIIPMYLLNTKNCIYLEADDKQGIILELDDFHEVNHIRIELPKEDRKSTYYSYYGYYVEVSLDKSKWQRVVDYTTYKCNSWQNLYFETRLVRYVRFVATRIQFKLSNFEVKCVENPPKIHNQIVEPTKNVAIVDMGARVIGTSCKDILLDGKLDYETNRGHVSSDGGHIIIQLGQPYIIGSMRLFLYSLEDTSFKFYLETSIDGENWEMAVDKRDSWQREWVDSTFVQRPATFVRITGTESNNGKTFSCVHFECPSTAAKTNENASENPR